MKNIFILSVIFCILLPVAYSGRSVDIIFGDISCNDDGKINIGIGSVEGKIKTKYIQIVAKEKEPIMGYGKILRYEPTGKEINITGHFWSYINYQERLVQELTENATHDPRKNDFIFISDTFFNHTQTTEYDLDISYPYYEDDEKKYENETYSNIECPPFKFSCDLVLFDVKGCEQKGDELYISFITQGFDQPQKINLIKDFSFEIKGKKSMMDNLPEDAELIEEGIFSKIKLVYNDEVELIKINSVKVPCTINEKKIFKCKQTEPIEEKEINITEKIDEIEEPINDTILENVTEKEVVKESTFFVKLIEWFKNIFS